MLSLLAQGNNGNEILSILDTLVDDTQSDVAYAQPTADVIEFWYLWVLGLTLWHPYVILVFVCVFAVIWGRFLKRPIA